jgi:hypothetical protein
MPIDVPPPRGPIFVFGEYFLRKFYTVFDRDESVLGFALANQSQEENKNIKSIVTPYDDSEDEIEKMQEQTSENIRTTHISTEMNLKERKSNVENNEIRIKESQTAEIKSSSFKSSKTKDFLSQSPNGALPKSSEESDFFKDVLEEANNSSSQQNNQEEKSFIDELNVENLKKDNNFIEP